MVLEFPIRADYATIDVDNHHFFLTHGHLFDENNLPNLNSGVFCLWNISINKWLNTKWNIYN